MVNKRVRPTPGTSLGDPTVCDVDDVPQQAAFVLGSRDRRQVNHRQDRVAVGVAIARLELRDPLLPGSHPGAGAGHLFDERRVDDVAVALPDELGKGHAQQPPHGVVHLEQDTLGVRDVHRDRT